MLMPDKFANEEDAKPRFGFNGMEREDEIAGLGNSYTAKFWQYDSRTARRWNQDPVDMFSLSRYATFANNPIFYTDPFGDKIKISDLTRYFNINNGEFSPNFEDEAAIQKEYAELEQKFPGQTDPKEVDELIASVVNYRLIFKDAAMSLMSDWSRFTGYKLKYNSNGYLEKIGEIEGAKSSETARAYFDYLLESEETLEIDFASNADSHGEYNTRKIILDPN